MKQDFNPALYYRFFTPFYDWLFKHFLPEQKIRSTLISQLSPEGGTTLIDLGCGTATLTIQLAQTFEKVNIIGIDADKEILAFAEKKMHPPLANLHLKTGNCTQLNLKNDCVEMVVSSLLFCNLSDEHKQKTIAEVSRILKPSGCYYLAEWGKPDTIFTALGFYILRLLGGFKNTKTMRNGELPDFLKRAGFSVKQFAKINTLLGTVCFYEARVLST